MYIWPNLSPLLVISSSTGPRYTVSVYSSTRDLADRGAYCAFLRVFFFTELKSREGYKDMMLIYNSDIYLIE